MPTTRPLKVFLCHASADKPAVRKLYHYLRERKMDPWLDAEKLLPGQNWKAEIPKALLSSDVIIICLSKNSVDKEGYVQEEIKFALDKTLEMPEGRIFLIPSRLEECDLPHSLSSYHYVNLFEENGYRRLLKSLRVRAQQIGATKVSVGEDTTLPDAEKVAYEKAEHEKIEQDTAEKAAREKADRAAADKADRAAAEKAIPAAGQEPISRNNIPTYLPSKTRSESSSFLRILVIGLLALTIISLFSWGVYQRVKPTPKLTIGSTMIGEDGAVLAYVPEGKFVMGSAHEDLLADGDEKPQHLVDLTAFWIDQTEVTNELFSSFVSITGYQTDAEKLGSSSVYDGANWVQTNGADWQHPAGPSSNISGIEQHPVIHVSWNDAVAYCEWAGRRLPTEAEWEKAASWNDLTQEKYVYPWGNEFNGSIVNFCDKNCVLSWANKNSDDGFAAIAPVGNYPNGVSPYGVYDMAGNVWEWVNDWYQSGYYATLGDTASNPQGTSSGDGRVVRGGAWYQNFSYVRSADRNWNNPTYPGYDVGFRCARDATP